MRVESLTFFRFIAAIIVVCFHFGKETSIPAWFGDIAISGAQMVTFFFVLSGFVMMISHHHKHDQPISAYYVSRIARIVPIYLLALAPFALVYSDPLGFLLSATLTQAWFSPYPLQPNVPGWSLSVEMFFYLLFPWLLIVVRRYKATALTVSVFAVLLYLLTQAILSRLIQPDIYPGDPSFIHDLIFFFPLSHLCSFVLGMAAGKLYLEREAFFNNRGLLQRLLCFGALLVTYLVLNDKQAIIGLFPFPVVLGSSFLAPLFVLLIFGVASSDNLLTRVLSRPGFVFLGEISFCLYIIQLPVEALCRMIFPGVIVANGDLFFVGYLVVLVLISAVVHWFFERPCKDFILRVYYSGFQQAGFAVVR